MVFELYLTRKCADIPSGLLGYLGPSPSLYGRGTGGVPPKLLPHAVIDSGDIGCKKTILTEL